MTVDIEKLFTPISRSAYHFLIANGQGCYIPAYQRPYSWKTADVDRLFEDVVGCCHEMLARPDAIRFLGAVIAIHDSKYITVNPIARPEVANRVMSIIDGQQRLSTFVLLNIAIHDLSWKLLQRLQGVVGDAPVWVCEQILQLKAQLQKTFELDTDLGNDEYRFYPRIIRAYDDMWSRKKNVAFYNSPIAQLTWSYICHHRKSPESQFVFSPKIPQGKKNGNYQLVDNIFKHMRKSLQSVLNENLLPDLLELLQSQVFTTSLWGYELPEHVSLFVAESSRETHFEDIRRAIRLIVFAKVLNDRMAFTVVQAQNEDDAFDIFEALNTTGEPLTPYETFKPKVIEAETLQQFEDSPSKKLLDEIEEYLEQFPKAEQKLAATTDLLIPFALAETGYKLGKKSQEQRTYLRHEYELRKSIYEKRDFLEDFASIASFMRTGWSTDQRPFSSINVDQEFLVCFDLLREMKHNIVVAPLSLFFYAIRKSLGLESEQKQVEFLKAVKFTTAFTAIWRGAFGGTNGIDAVYRKVVRDGNRETGIPAFARRPPIGAGAISLSNYRTQLLESLNDKDLGNKEKWVEKVARVPLYKHSKPLTRFLLFCAGHDAVNDDSSPGLLRKGRSGVSELLRRDIWQDSNFLTIEHVAPQKQNGNWSATIYEDPDLVHTLGNLTLMPLEENVVLNDRPWHHKRHIYRLVSALDQAAYDLEWDQLKDKGVFLTTSSSEILEKSSHLKMCESIGSREDDWTAEFIHERSRRIAELAWVTLAKWTEI